uniref:Hydroxyacylglutathione hydrolase like n=1 Tax=Leptobrachium leishanense TaxID=445787 RepID=A0A8C5Q7K9_9ANUR
MKVKVISILDDNYMYLVIEERTRDAFAVDAAVSKKLVEILRKENASLKAVLTTHHHLDHTRDNVDLVQRFPGLQVYGADDRIRGLTHTVVHDQELKFGDINVRCLFTPCHTSGHMCFFVWEDGCPDAPALFSGDTLFQMFKNLFETLGSLPPDTKVFCGHEYTVRNLKFALKVEPDNEDIKRKLAWAKARDEDDIPTVPSSLEEELTYNPFMRVKEETVQKFTGKTDPVEVMRLLQKEKDSFKKPKDQMPIPAILAYQLSMLNRGQPITK